MSFRKEALVRLGAAAIFLGGCSSRPTNQPSNVIETPSVPTEIIPLPSYHQYESDSQEVIASLESRGVVVFSPVSWPNWFNSYVKTESLPWTKEELEMLAQSIDELPPSYLVSDMLPINLVLVKFIVDGDEDRYAFAGNYRPRQISFNLPNIDLSEIAPPPPLGAFFNSYSEMFKFIAIHEFTHAFMDIHPEILDEWISHFNWRVGPDGTWINDKPQEFPPYYNYVNPAEEIADAVAFVAIAPEGLSRDRFMFLANNHYFMDWNAISP